MHVLVLLLKQYRNLKTTQFALKFISKERPIYNKFIFTFRSRLPVRKCASRIIPRSKVPALEDLFNYYYNYYNEKVMNLIVSIQDVYQVKQG